MELLRQFRAEVPEPDEETRARVLARITAGEGRRRGRSFVRLPAQTRLTVAAFVGVATSCAAVALLLLSPWQHGPGALAPAQAALVLRRVAEATSPRPGWIFHERMVTLSPGAPQRTAEAWRQDAPPYRFRVVSRWSNSRSPVEVGGTTRPAIVFVYDGATRKLYRNPPQVPISPGPFQDQAAALRQQLAGKPVTPQGGHWKVEAKTKLDGHSVYELALVMPPPVGYVGLTYYVDAKTYVPVQIESAGVPNVMAKQVTRVVGYEYLQPTVVNLKLADIRAQHSAAPVVSGTEMPARLLAQLGLQ